MPPELRALAAGHAAAVAAGTARAAASGFTTMGFKFDAAELDAAGRAKRAARRHLEIEAGLTTVEDAVEEDEALAAAAAADEDEIGRAHV